MFPCARQEFFAQAIQNGPTSFVLSQVWRHGQPEGLVQPPLAQRLFRCPNAHNEKLPEHRDSECPLYQIRAWERFILALKKAEFGFSRVLVSGHDLILEVAPKASVEE